MRRRGLVSQAAAPRDAWLVMARLMRGVLVGILQDTDTRVGVRHFLATPDVRAKISNLSSRLGLLSSLSSVSTKEHARSSADSLVDVLYPSICASSRRFWRVSVQTPHTWLLFR